MLLRIPGYRIAPELPAPIDNLATEPAVEPAPKTPARQRRPLLALSMLAFVVLGPLLFLLASRPHRPEAPRQQDAELGEIMIIPAPGAPEGESSAVPTAHLQFSDEDPCKAALLPEIVPLEEGDSP